jgi:Aspartyl protease
MRPTLAPLLLLVAAGCHRTGATPPTDGPPEPASPVAAWDMSGYIEVPLSQTKTGSFQVEVEIGTERLNMLLDTGAESVILDRKVVTERLKSPLNESQIKGSTIGAASVTTHSTPLPPLKIGPFTSDSCEALVVDLSHPNEARSSFGVPRIDGILGSPFLRTHKAVIDYPRKRLFLLELAMPEYRPAGWMTPSTLREYSPPRNGQAGRREK